MIRPNIIRTRGGATLGQTFASLAYYGYITNSLIHPREKSQSLDIPTVTKPPVFYTRDTCQGPVSLLHPHPFRFDKELKRPRTGAPCLLPRLLAAQSARKRRVIQSQRLSLLTRIQLSLHRKRRAVIEDEQKEYLKAMSWLPRDQGNPLNVRGLKVCAIPQCISTILISPIDKDVLEAMKWKLARTEQKLKAYKSGKKKAKKTIPDESDTNSDDEEIDVESDGVESEDDDGGGGPSHVTTVCPCCIHYSDYLLICLQFRSVGVMPEQNKTSDTG